MLTLLLLLAVGRATESLGDAGLTVTAHALAIAIASPVLGRLADRFGPRQVLLWSAGVHTAVGLGMLACLARGAPAPVLVAAAALLGATTPPGAPVTRQLWPSLVPRDRLRSAYAFDSVTNSATFIAGPALAGAGTVLVSPTSAIALTLLLRIAGISLLATAPFRQAAGERDKTARATRWGPLANSQIRLLLTVVLLDTASYGCAQIAAVAVSRGNSAAGLFAILAVGEVIGGFLYGLRHWAGTPRSQLVGLHLIAALVFIVATPLPALGLLALLYLGAGVASGARDTLNQLLLGDSAKAEYRTETFAWLATFMWAGFGIGTAAAGQLTDHLGVRATFIAAATCGVAAALLARHLTTSKDRTASTR